MWVVFIGSEAPPFFFFQQFSSLATFLSADDLHNQQLPVWPPDMPLQIKLVEGATNVENQKKEKRSFSFLFLACHHLRDF